ncbi:hypothetical protein, partial [Azospirillum brasilense]|uniref:hypothetical protein n=1 Tax=Azospirillum brasilense TaxID=192 RepID=UPI001B3B522C
MKPSSRQTTVVAPALILPVPPRPSGGGRGREAEGGGCLASARAAFQDPGSLRPVGDRRLVRGATSGG